MGKIITAHVCKFNVYLFIIYNFNFSFNVTFESNLKVYLHNRLHSYTLCMCNNVKKMVQYLHGTWVHTLFTFSIKQNSTPPLFNFLSQWSAFNKLPWNIKFFLVGWTVVEKIHFFNDWFLILEKNIPPTPTHKKCFDGRWESIKIYWPPQHTQKCFDGGSKNILITPPHTQNVLMGGGVHNKYFDPPTHKKCSDGGWGLKLYWPPLHFLGWIKGVGVYKIFLYPRHQKKITIYLYLIK